MKSVDLDTIPYKLRYNGASVLIAKANRLSGMSGSDKKPDDKSLFAAVAYQDMALTLLKPFDVNYLTIVNWKCNALRRHKDTADATSGVADFDESPYLRFEQEFCTLLIEGNCKRAHGYLSSELRKDYSLAELKAEWKQMTHRAHSSDIELSLQ